MDLQEVEVLINKCTLFDIKIDDEGYTYNSTIFY
jgi:hypothetical protein